MTRDIAPVHALDRIDAIDANLGELSQFQEAYGFYVHGVAIDAAVLPNGKKERTIAVQNQNTRNMTGWCVGAHDLAASKLVAYREKDRDFVRVLIVEGLVDPKELLLRIDQLPSSDKLPAELRQTIVIWVKGIMRDIGRAT
ncbi:MAG: DUF6036 family nucleotidyltransferase [Gemmatimonadaceae bacterium]